MNKSDIILSLKPILKEKEFKKIRNYWYKVQNGMTFYLNIQGSAYSHEDYYVNLGVVLSSPDKNKIPPIYEWDICRRVFVDEKQINFDLEDVLFVLDYFLDSFSEVEEVKTFIINQKKGYKHIVISGRYKLA